MRERAKGNDYSLGYRCESELAERLKPDFTIFRALPCKLCFLLRVRILSLWSMANRSVSFFA